MLAKVEKKVIYTGLEERVSKKTGEKFYLVVIGDPVNFERHDFFKRDDLDLTGINEGDQVNITLSITKRGYNTNIDLVNISK